MLLGIRPSQRKIEKELSAIELTPRNRALLASYFRDQPVEYRTGVAARAGAHHLQDLYKISPNSTRAKAAGAWFFDVVCIGQNAQQFIGRDGAMFQVCEARMAGAEMFWRDDLIGVMKNRCPIADRFTVFTADAAFTLEHVALPVFAGNRIAAIVGAFDVVDSGASGRLEWADAKRVQRTFSPLILSDMLNLKRGGAGRQHGAFCGVFHVLPRALPHWRRSEPAVTAKPLSSLGPGPA